MLHCASQHPCIPLAPLAGDVHKLFATLEVTCDETISTKISEAAGGHHLHDVRGSVFACQLGLLPAATPALLSRVVLVLATPTGSLVSAAPHAKTPC